MAALLCRTWCRIVTSKHDYRLAHQLTRCYATASVKGDEGVLKRVKKFVFGEAVSAEQLDQSESVYYELKEAKTPPVYNMQPDDIKNKLDSIIQESISTDQNWLSTDIADDIVKFKVLQRCYEEFGVIIPSYRLNNITRVQDILDYYQRSFKKPSNTFSTLDIEDIPQNLKIGGRIPRK